MVAFESQTTTLVVAHEAETESSHHSATVTITDQAELANCTDWSDISNWPQRLTDAQRIFLVEMGPARITDCQLPTNEFGRHFSAYYNSRKLANGETVDRRWLVYSKLCDKVFCFCCRIFSMAKASNNFASVGCCNRQNLSKLLHEHEVGATNISALCERLEFERRLKQEQTINKSTQKQFDAEKLHWHAVLEHPILVTHFLTVRNLAFRGSVEKLGHANNSNFLGLVEVIAKFDPVLSEHIRRIKNEELADHYLGKNHAK